MYDSRFARKQNEWDGMKETLVLKLLREKFVQCKAFSSALQDSGSKGLVHNVLDPWWGTGSKEPEVIRGKNIFGRLLEQIRKEIDSRKEQASAQCPYLPRTRIERSSLALFGSEMNLMVKKNNLQKT